MSEEISNTGQQFSARDFSTVDDIISVIDSKKSESTEASTDTREVDRMDEGIEYGVGREKNKFSINNDELQDEKDSEKASDVQSEGTQEEQSVSSKDTEVDEPDAEESVEASDSQSDDSKESDKTDTSDEDGSVDLKEDEELVVSLDDGTDVPIDTIIEEWQNNQNWQKSNTEKAQQLADQKREFEESISTFNKDEIKDALNNEELQQALDDWFESEDKNPFRKAVLPDTIEVEQQGDQDNSIDEERIMLNVEKEIFDLQKKDESLSDKSKLDNLLQFAMDNDVKLDTAHRLMQFDSIKDEFDEVKKELKDRNEELSKLKKQAQKSVPTELPKGKGAVKEEFSGSAGTWNGAEDRVLAKLGLK